MIIEQTITIPADYRILLELPKSVPSGIKAQVKIDIPSVSVQKNNDLRAQTSLKIGDIRKILRNEMKEKDTLTEATASGDGWEAYVKERYVQS
ncbi:MAG: hypothetical protein FWD78_02110 [Treponema sp.]|nr:hypothetical protein [Treponema sp.]